LHSIELFSKLKTSQFRSQRNYLPL